MSGEAKAFKAGMGILERACGRSAVVTGTIGSGSVEC